MAKIFKLKSLGLEKTDRFTQEQQQIMLYLKFPKQDLEILVKLFLKKKYKEVEKKYLQLNLLNQLPRLNHRKNQLQFFYHRSNFHLKNLQKKWKQKNPEQKNFKYFKTHKNFMGLFFYNRYKIKINGKKV